MKQRFLSIILCITLMASVIAGAISVSLSHTSAQGTSESGTISIQDFWSDIQSLGIVSQGTYTDFYNYVNPKVTDNDNTDFLVYVVKGAGLHEWALTVFETQGAYYWWYGYDRVNFGSGNTNTIPSRRIFVKAYFATDGQSYICRYNSNFYSDTYYRCEPFSFSNLSGSSFACAIPGPGNFNNDSYKNYISTSIYPGNWGSLSSKNLQQSSVVFDFEIVTFYLGERLYLTTVQQNYFRNMDPDKMDYTFAIMHDSQDEVLQFTWNDVILLPSGTVNFVNVTFTDISPSGIYAIDITDNQWIVIDVAIMVEYDSQNNGTMAGTASNVPYRIGSEDPEPGTNGTPDSYTEVWNNWNTYITNYPNTPVVPQDLVPQFYNTQAASCKPCEVAPPSSLWNARHDVTTFGQDIFEYHFPLVSAPAYNYELFDVCVLSRQGIVTGDILEWDYTLMWWYSESSNPKSTKIQDLNFDVLMEMFDIIIVVDDPDLVLMDSNGDLVYTGDYEYGFTYSPDAFTHQHVLYGFAFVTEKAVQKQLLFNFNDGIRKTYDLMEQYIDHREAWDNSFLDWTTTLFTQYQTIFGKLDDIYKVLFTWDGLLQNISDKLDQIAENTSEDDPGYWFISFYNWVKRWEPSNSDFANWVDSWDDYTDDLPDPGSGVTVIPLPTSIPTAAVAGG